VFLLDLVLILAPVMVFYGMRHAVDVDHVTAIDSLVRMNNADENARWIGTAFSAGHMSAVLFEMVAIIFFVGTVTDSGGVTQLQFWGGITGAIALALIGLSNIYSMRKWGKTGSAILAKKIFDRTGFLGTMGSGFSTGFVFGLGFDTATQISAITLTAVASATSGIVVALVLFGFFAAGMIAVDTVDSVFLREGFSKILGTKAFRMLSYGLSLVALLVAFAESYRVILNTELLPRFTGAGLAVSLIGATFAYAYLRGRRETRVQLREQRFP
jgi:high-affinity nickel-transport protein